MFSDTMVGTPCIHISVCAVFLSFMFMHIITCFCKHVVSDESDRYVLINSRLSVLNAATWLVCDSRRYDHISPLLCDLHWLRVPVWIKFRLAILVFHCRSNTAPAYLSWAADSDTRSRLCSSSSNKLVMPQIRLKTVGDCAFGAVAAWIWNDLPPIITNASSMSALKKHLKSCLFNQYTVLSRFTVSLWLLLMAR